MIYGDKEMVSRVWKIGANSVSIFKFYFSKCWNAWVLKRSVLTTPLCVGAISFPHQKVKDENSLNKMSPKFIQPKEGEKIFKADTLKITTMITKLNGQNHYVGPVVTLSKL